MLSARSVSRAWIFKYLLSETRPMTTSSIAAGSFPHKQMYDRIIRVDQSGELAAHRIYQGQCAILGDTASGPIIRHMWEQEKVHLATFNKLIGKHRVRPSAMLPIWNVAGFILGAGTALLGKEAAMACTVAVEDTIVKHYDNQIRELMAKRTSADEHQELLDTIKKFRDEELEHHDTGIEHDAEKAPQYEILTQVIKIGCKGAIWISERF